MGEGKENTIELQEEFGEKLEKEVIKTPGLNRSDSGGYRTWKALTNVFGLSYQDKDEVTKFTPAGDVVAKGGQEANAMMLKQILTFQYPNRYHDHGTQTMAGLSGFLWLKVPECISKLDEGPAALSDASGSVDGFTHLVWGTASRKDIFQLKAQTEEYVKPEVGVMLIFPCWLKHQVLPFFGEGERRSLAMNWNVTDSEQELMKHLSAREKEQYEKNKED